MGCRAKGSKGRKPTRAQKIIMSNKNLNVQNWLVLIENSKVMYIESKKTGRIKCISKE